MKQLQFENNPLKRITRLTLSLFIFLMFSCAEDFSGENALKVDDIISFDVQSGSLSVLADGYTTVDIVVSVDADDDQAVTFVTEQGSFQGTGASSNKKSIVVTSTASKATARLISDQVVNDAVPVTASVTKNDKTYTNTTFVKFIPANPVDFYITSDKNIVKADQTASATITLNVTRTGLSKVSSGLIANITLVPSGTITADAVKYVKTVADPILTPVTFSLRSTNNGTGTIKVVVTMDTDTGAGTTEREINFNP